MVDCFGYDITTRTSVIYWSSNVIFDISIWDNNNSFRIQAEVFKDFVKFTNISILDIFIFVIYYMKEKTIRKIVY